MKAHIRKLKTSVKDSSNWVKTISILSIILLAIALKFGYAWLNTKSETAAKPMVVQTIKPKRSSMPEYIETVGILEAKQELKLKAGIAGRVERLLVESGSFVKAGTVLLTILGGSAEVKAPFDGHLTDWKVKPGEYLQSGTELVDLVNTDILLLTYKVPEQYAEKLNPGQTLEVFARAFPDHNFQGTVQFVSPVVDKKTFTILVRAQVQNSNQQLWSGMSAKVRHMLHTFPEATVIPEACLVLTLEGYEVLLVSDGKLVRRSVKVGSRKGGRVHILSGVELTDSVLMTRNYAVTEGSLALAEDWMGDW